MSELQSAFHRLLHLTKNRQYSDALRWAEQSLPASSDALNPLQIAILGDLFDQVGLNAYADVLHQKLVAQIPENQAAVFRYALCAYDRGDLELALQRANQIPIDQWEIGRAVNMLTHCAIKLQEDEMAYHYLEQGISDPVDTHKNIFILLSVKFAYWIENDLDLVLKIYSIQNPQVKQQIAIISALAAVTNGDIRYALQILSENRDRTEKQQNYQYVCVYEIYRRAGFFDIAMQSLNSVFLSSGLAPLETKDFDNHFDFAKLKCDPNLLPAIVNERLISVIMTVHQWNPYLDLAIQSVVQQTYQNVQILIVVDGEADKKTHILLDQWLKKDSRITLFGTPYNQGTYAAKNLGITSAKGDFIAFMDSDDWSHPQRLEHAISVFDRDETGVYAICDDAIRIAPDGSLGIRDLIPVKDAPISLVFRRSMLEFTGVFDEVRCSGDSEFCSRIKKVLGEDALKYTQVITIIQSFGDHCLTVNGEFGYDWRGLMGDRFVYFQQFQLWQKAANMLGIDMRITDGKIRKIYAPESIVSSSDSTFTDFVNEFAYQNFPRITDFIKNSKDEQPWTRTN